MNDNDALRMQAVARMAQLPKNIAALSPEQMEMSIHELHVHQIELDIQNEELRRIQHEIEALRTRYFDLYELAPVGYLSVGQDGIVHTANLFAANMLGVPRSKLLKRPVSSFIVKEDQDSYYLFCKQIYESSAVESCDLRMVKDDGTHFWAHLAATVVCSVSDEVDCLIVITDITEHKLQEDERDLTARLITLLNSPGALRERMAELSLSLQGWSGCEAVGIRLHDGNDYPYYVTYGFPPAFVEMEHNLCALGANGEVLRDAAGTPLLECLCGKVISGHIEHAKPYFTPHGSFWHNRATSLLDDPAKMHLRSHMRNRCPREGYESLALIPLRAGDTVFGLLQFNDHRPNRFTSAMIAHFERMADCLAIALQHRQDEEALLQKCSDLERFNHVVVDREMRMIELKREINALLKALGQPSRYESIDVVDGRNTKEVHDDHQ